MKTSLGYLRVLADDNEIQQDQAPPVVYTGSVGRPKFEITREQINFLVESGFTVSNHLQPTLPVYTTGGA